MMVTGLTYELIKQLKEALHDESFEAGMRRSFERRLHRIEQQRLEKEEKTLKELRARGYIQ